MKRDRGLTIVEVLVAMALLAIIAIATVTFMPLITRNTQAASVDTVESQMAITIFERIARDWSNPGAWGNELVYMDDGSTETIDVYVTTAMASVGRACTGAVSRPSAERRRVIITCPADRNLPERIIRAEFGDPSV